MNEVTDEIGRLLWSLADRFCARRALACLLRFLPAYFAPNGLTDGWEDCRQALADTRAFCRGDLELDEAEDIHTVMNLIDRILARR